MTRAIVEGMVDDFHYRVRIPILNKIAQAVGATPVDELAIATLAVPPGISPKFRSGNVVFVEFEEGDTSKPVICGALFNTLDSQTVSDAKFDSLVVDVNVVLPRDTSIGDVTPDNISNLEGLNTNVQYQIDRNNSEHAQFVQDINDIKQDITEINNDIDRIDDEINQINEEITQIHITDTRQDQQIVNVTNKVTSIENKLNGPLILNNLSYGTVSPDTITGAVEGQVYLWIQDE